MKIILEKIDLLKKDAEWPNPPWVEMHLGKSSFDNLMWLASTDLSLIRKVFKFIFNLDILGHLLGQIERLLGSWKQQQWLVGF